METNTNFLKLLGAIEISPEMASQIKYDTDYTITFVGSLDSTGDKPNGDGTINKVFRVKMTDIKEIK